MGEVYHDHIISPEDPPPIPTPAESEEEHDDHEGQGEGRVAEVKTPVTQMERDKWSSKLSYTLTLIGYAVGLGNIWRFPYQMRENGGIVFLIPYFSMLVLMGMPSFFMELAVGQRRRQGIVNAWNEISPWFGGLGICCGWICYLIGLYYNTLMAYCLSYFFDSFRNPLPWASCQASFKGAELKECEDELNGQSSKYYWHKTTLGASGGIEEVGGYNWKLCIYIIISWVANWAILCKGTKIVGYVVYFTALFPYVILFAFFIANLAVEPVKSWRGAFRLLRPDWSFLWNPLTWLAAGTQIFYSLGLASGSLVLYASYTPERNDCYRDAVFVSWVNCITSVLAALVVFPIIGGLGHRKYDKCISQMRAIFSPEKLPHLYENDKWYDIYFATDADNWEDVSSDNPILVRYGFGELNDEQKMKRETLRDDEVFEEVTDLTDVTYDSSLTVDMSLRDCSIGQEATASGAGTGFVFIGFTEAVIQLPGPNFWSLLFFFMLLTLGIDSAFGTVEGAVATMEELMQTSRVKATTIVCGTLGILSICLFPFGWGNYILELLDEYTSNWGLFLIAFAQCIAVSWCYGLARISYDVEMMTHKKPNLFILLSWKYLSPVIIVILLLGSIIKFIVDTNDAGGIISYNAFRPQDNESIQGDLRAPMPDYAIGVGYSLAIFCIIWIPVHILLRNTKYRLFAAKPLADFPENDLIEENNIQLTRPVSNLFSTAEQVIIGKSSMQDLRNYREDQLQKRKLHGVQSEGLENRLSFTSTPSEPIVTEPTENH